MKNFAEIHELLKAEKEVDISINSSCIRSALFNVYGGIYYPDCTIEMCLEFVNDSCYGYLVPLSIVKEFVEADSKGKYFNANIRGRYQGERM